MLKSTLSILAILFLSLPASSAPKKKVCNQLKVTQCQKRTDCTWVKQAKNKKAYCRNKPQAVKGKAIPKKGIKSKTK